MTTVRPTPLMTEAAEVLAPVLDRVVVIGAVAVQVALDGTGTAVSSTRDVDAGLRTEDVPDVVAALEAGELRRSELPNEQGFTWVRGDLKVQLLRPFHPHPSGPAKTLPVSNLIPELDRYRIPVRFEQDREQVMFWAASPAGLIALKAEAFGRTRPDGKVVDRDFADVVLLCEQLAGGIAAEVCEPSQMRERVIKAAKRIAVDPDSYASAARELTRIGQAPTHRAGELQARRATRNLLAELDA